MDEDVMAALACEIRYLHDLMPDVFLFEDAVGYVQAWKSGNVFHLECQGVKGEYYNGKFSDVPNIVGICESYFNALRAGYPLLEV